MIILTHHEALLQVSDLLNRYPMLVVVESNPEKIRLHGKIHIFRSACGFTLNKLYSIEIIVPLESPNLPTVVDLDGAINSSYPHRYNSGELCLETSTAIRFRFIDGFNLLAWVEEYVEPFYFSYEYFTRYGSFPFGERPHGLGGIVNTYQEMFNGTDIKQTLLLMKFCAEGHYRGHMKCPCGSEKKLRNCHGSVLLSIMNHPRKKDLVLEDIHTIRKEVDCHASRNNQ